MIKILFLCHGNICRSPMAEFIFKKKIRDFHLEDKLSCESMALTYEEEGNGLYYKTVEVLNKYKIPYTKHYARKVQKSDYDRFTYIFYMDKENEYYIKHTFVDSFKKCYMLTHFLGETGEVIDPWYTNKFDEVYLQLDSLLTKLIYKFVE